MLLSIFHYPNLMFCKKKKKKKRKVNRHICNDASLEMQQSSGIECTGAITTIYSQRGAQVYILCFTLRSSQNSWLKDIIYISRLLLSGLYLVIVGFSMVHHQRHLGPKNLPLQFLSLYFSSSSFSLCSLYFSSPLHLPSFLQSPYNVN